MKYIIRAPHSMVDLITNSSTEIFTINSDKELAVIKEMIREMERKFPNEYNHSLSVDYIERWQVDEIFNYIDEDDAVQMLTTLGYQITKPEENFTIKAICLSAERGGMHPEMKQFIEDTFQVINYTSEG